MRNGSNFSSLNLFLERISTAAAAVGHKYTFVKVGHIRIGAIRVNGVIGLNWVIGVNGVISAQIYICKSGAH